jgi:ribosomal-protein-alanine N-acetyltransferase
MPELDLSCCLVAEIDGKIVGVSGYKILSSNEGKTTLLAVDPECRKLGLGYALQKWRMEELLNENIRYLTTNADRPETIAWYKKHFGYQEIGSLQKEHEFGRPDIDHWTTLRTDLVAWKDHLEKQG